MIADQNPAIPREAVSGVATGLMLMTLFTTMWACIANAGLNGRDYHIVLAVFILLALTFLVNGIRMFGKAKSFPMAISEQDIAERKKAGKWFGIIFGAEGLGIFIAVNIVVNIGHPELVIPTIALVVGLHFYPIAKVFKRKIDYYLATWATLVAVLGILFSLNKTLTEPGVFAFVGIGIAIATSCYGIYMIYYGTRLVRQPL
jgi:hypothetical protein